MPTVPQGVVLARHGQTEWNVVGRRQGQLDSPLTAQGVACAQRLSTAFEGRGIGRVLTSPLGRARQTADIFARALDLDVVVIEDLAEVHHGLMAGLNNSEIMERFPTEWAVREYDRYRWRFPGGESYEDADARAARVLAVISARSGMPLIVTHEMIGRMIRRQLLNLSVGEALALVHRQDTAFLMTDNRSHGLR